MTLVAPLALIYEDTTRSQLQRTKKNNFIRDITKQIIIISYYLGETVNYPKIKYLLDSTLSRDWCPNDHVMAGIDVAGVDRL